MEFEVSKPLRIHMQSKADECTSCALSAVSEDITGVPMDDDFIYQNSSIEGEFGITPDEAIESIFKDGVKPLAGGIAVFPFKKMDSALPWIFRFDSIVRMLQRNKRSFFCGIYWQGNWDIAPKGIMEMPGTWMTLFPHAIKIYGITTINGIIYLKVQNSLGPDKGDGGIWYMPKEVANKLNFAYQLL